MLAAMHVQMRLTVACVSCLSHKSYPVDAPFNLPAHGCSIVSSKKALQEQGWPVSLQLAIVYSVLWWLSAVCMPVM